MVEAAFDNTLEGEGFLPQPARLCPKPTVLVMHASVGSGHRSAAEAIGRALQDELDSGAKATPEQPDDVNVEVLDSLRFSRVFIDGNAYASGFVGPTRPFYDVTWRYWLSGRIVWNGSTIWLDIMFPKFIRWIELNDPAAIVCTHINAANIAAGARLITKKTYPIICVPTDYEAEGFWPVRTTDLFCAASEYMAETLRARGVPESGILVTGIPVNPKFSVPHDAAKAREKWGFDPNKKVALVLAGAKLPKPYQRFRDTLFELLPRLRSLPDMQFVFLSGSDAAYAEKLRERIAVEGLENVVVLDYVNEMAELMAACDFAICKAGGLSVTECLCAKIPMILVGKAYGQEKVNVRLLTSLGAALHVQTARELYNALSYVTNEQIDLESFVRNGTMLRRPNAAQDIARATLKLAFTPVTEEQALERTTYQGMFGIGKKPAHTR